MCCFHPRGPASPPAQSRAPLTCTVGTAMRVPGDWSLRWPVIHAFRPVSCLRSGRTCRDSEGPAARLAESAHGEQMAGIGSLMQTGGSHTATCPYPVWLVHPLIR